MTIFHVYPEFFDANYKLEAQDSTKARAVAIATIAPKHRGERLYLADTSGNLIALINPW